HEWKAPQLCGAFYILPQVTAITLTLRLSLLYTLCTHSFANPVLSAAGQRRRPWRTRLSPAAWRKRQCDGDKK
ncbi:hypothetical protein, partial [Pantoea sp. Pa-EAmG]|uniref:hypothetical protein n=1 Tax=Pantoea sp. Pa-EAmG TaxID=3043311 RepID=UPI0024AEBA80